MTNKQYEQLGQIIKGMVFGHAIIVNASNQHGNLLYSIYRKEQLARQKKKK